MFVEPTTIATAAELAISHRQIVLPAIRRIRYWIKHGRLRIVMFGPGGVGKTTLGQFLTGQLDMRPTARYQESIDVEEYRLPGDVVCSLIVPPGQETRRDQWSALYHSLATGRSRGVINIVSWGYHSFDALTYQETRQYTSGMSKRGFLQSYLADRRQRELEVMAELTPRLMDAPDGLWMITLVTKQDLWWNDRRAVTTHYMDGDYDQFIQQLRAHRGIANFRHEYVSSSVVINNFATAGGEVLAPTTAGYDQPTQQANLSALLRIVNSLTRGSP